MPTQVRWDINSEDSAAIFGAVHRGFVPTAYSTDELIPVIANWLDSHPFLEQKYGGSNFRNNFGRNFRNVIRRHERWKSDPCECHLYYHLTCHLFLTVLMYTSSKLEAEECH
jgi:hypothetical protein